MKTKITLLLVCVVGLLFFTMNSETAIEKKRKQHLSFFQNHPYQKSLRLTKLERKKQRIAPNKYFEEEFLLEMNPVLGYPEYEKKFALQATLANQPFLKNVPGSATNAWVERGPNNVPGRTRAILFDPNDNTNKRVFAGGISGGLWVNNDITNQNSAWAQVGIPENLAVSSITVDPNNSNIMYLGTGESYTGNAVGNGIYKSTNGGASWSKIFGGSTGAAFFNGNVELTINSPASIAGDIQAVRAGFGPTFTSAITGNLVLVDDGSSASTEGCGLLTNGAAVNGNIAVVERGSCNFTVKVKNAQDQGATAVIVINNIAQLPFAMGGTDATVTIPSAMISKNDGATLLATLQSQAINATVNENGSDFAGGLLVPGIFHVNDIVTRNNGGSTEIYAAISDSRYRDASGTILGDGTAYGLYRSTNAGNTWSKINLPLTTNGNPYSPNDIEIGPDNTVWLSTTNSPSFGDGGGTIFSSSNGTAFIEKFVVPNGERTEIEVSATDADKVYVLAETGTVTIIRTDDNFVTTSNLTLPNDTSTPVPANDFTSGQAFYDLMLEADPSNDDIVYVGGINTFRSTNSGSTWSQISRFYGGGPTNVPTVHPDVHELVFDSSNPNKGLIATDGGVSYVTSFSGAESSTNAIFDSDNNYNTTQFYKGAIGQNVGNLQLLAGAQDNGTSFINGAGNGINAASPILGGDGTYCFIDKDGDYLIASLQYSVYVRFNLPFTGGGLTIVDDDDTGSFINRADLDDNLNILYADGVIPGTVSTPSTFRISRYINITTSNPVRQNFSNGLLNTSPTVLKVSPFTTNSTTLFAATASARLLKVTNANQVFPSPVWTDISGPEFVGSISDVSFGANENEILVTFHNYGVKSIWYTNDGGVNWVDKEGDFPDIPVKAIMRNPLLNDEVIIGTDLGVWRTANFSSTNPNWVQSQNGMQNVKVTSFDLRTADNTVLATTYGRGMFTGKFTSEPLSVEDIEADDDRVQLYPNPSDGVIQLNTSLDFGNSTIGIFDINGRQVYRKESAISGATELNLSTLSKGVYILSIRGEKYAYNRKIIMQ